ncbi:MAG: DUF6252 family protein [Salibacteraceae bacterium]
MGFALVFIGSCSKGASTTAGSASKVNELNTKMNGQPWNGSILSWAVSGGTRQINANANNGSSIQIFMPTDTTGVFSANEVTVSYNDGTTTWSNNISGFVSVTSNNDDQIEGTFEMVVASYFNSDTLTFTAGSFYFKSI